jgi:hypothetical protein
MVPPPVGMTLEQHIDNCNEFDSYLRRERKSIYQAWPDGKYYRTWIGPEYEPIL